MRAVNWNRIFWFNVPTVLKCFKFDPEIEMSPGLIIKSGINYVIIRRIKLNVLVS